MGKEKFMKKIAQRTIRSPKDFMIAIFDELDQNELEFSTLSGMDIFSCLKQPTVFIGEQ
jgi:hypothetical protein